MDKRLKYKWKGIFNYSREIHILYAYAYTERQAWLTMCRRISDRHGVRLEMVTGLFNGERDNYTIERG